MNADGYGFFATEERKGHKGRKRLARLGQGDGCRDWISRAFDREREHARVPRWPPEYESLFAHFFRCVCCGRTRGDEKRREPDSEVCIHCVADAGFLN